MTETTTETCDNTVIDAMRSIMSALGQDITCDKAKGYLLLVGLSVVLVIIVKFFILKK